ELSANETEVRIEAPRDYRRQQVDPLSAGQLERVVDLSPSVDALTNDATRMLDQALPEEEAGDGDLGELIDRMLADQAATLARLKEGWVERSAAMKDWLDEQFAARPSPFGMGRPRQCDCERWLGLLRDWAADAAAE